MLCNYHTHTVRCHHASGSDRDYVEYAVKCGIKELGFSDHAPHIFNSGEVNGAAMLPNEAFEYVDSLLALREEYKNQIKLYIGFELEYYEDCFERDMKFFSKLPLDYLILGQHFADKFGGINSFAQTDNCDYLKTYVDTVIKGIETGVYTYIAHPDVYRFEGDMNCYRDEMMRLCECARKHNIPLEANMQGAGGRGNKRRIYPRQEFFDVASKIGNEVILGCDAHVPEMLDNPEGYDECMRVLSLSSITPIERPILVKP